MAGRIVLLVEDEQPLLEVFAEAISDMGHRVVCASDGDEGLTKAKEEKPDLILADCMLPRRTGVELLRALRTENGLERVPIVLMSAGRPRGVEEAWRFLPKPVALRDLESVVREGLSARTVKDPAAARPINVSPLVLAREEMLNWVAHEIRSPLGAALISVDMLRGRLADRAPDMLPRLEVVRRQLVRMNDLVASVLDASYIEEGRMELKLSPVPVVPFLRKVVREWQEARPTARIVADIGDDERILLRVDEARIRQILDNLFTNALKYAGADSPIAVSLGREAETVTIRLRDHGPGIPSDQLPRIFDRFFRVDDTPGRGHGLGLYIAAALAHLHGGSLKADLAKGGGTVFSLRLPAVAQSPPRVSQLGLDLDRA